MTAQHDAALATAEAYLTSWVEGDIDRLRSLVSEDVAIVLPYSGNTPVPAYRFDGAEAALDYLQLAHATFERLTFLDQQWVVSQDARFVYLHAVGDMVATPNGKDYDNVYLFRMAVDGERITEVLEHTNPVIWADLGLG